MLFFYEPRYAKFQCLFRRFMVAREYAKSILSYMENTPIDLKWAYLGKFLPKTTKKIWSKITSPNMIEWAKRTSYATVPLNPLSELL